MIPAVPLLEVRELSLQYAVLSGRRKDALEAVHRVNLEVFAGEILAIVGESGCGKTSLARAMLGLLPISSGEILFRGTPVRNMDSGAQQRWRQEVQFLFQDPHSALSPRRCIDRTLLEPLEVRGVKDADEQREKILAALQDVNLSADILQLYPHQLSGGQKQRIALARALLCQPSLIIADEPFSALDVSEQARLLKLFTQLRDGKQIGFVVIAHDLAVVQQLADRVAVMYLGRLLELASAQDFFDSAAHPYSQALLRASQRGWEFGTGKEPVLPGEPPSALTPPAGCVFHTRCAQRQERCNQDVPSLCKLASSGSGSGSHQVHCHLYPAKS